MLAGVDAADDRRIDSSWTCHDEVVRSDQLTVAGGVWVGHLQYVVI